MWKFVDVETPSTLIHTHTPTPPTNHYIYYDTCQDIFAAAAAWPRLPPSPTPPS